MHHRLVISGDIFTVKAVLNIDEGEGAPDWSHVYDINGLKFQAYSINFDGYGFDSSQVSIDLYRVKEKSQEEVAAEEAVRKAQESLKAAEDVLNKVKKEK